MAPICHTTPMKLFLEESLVDSVDENMHRMNVGSGVFGKCLSIPVKSCEEEFELCSIIRKGKPNRSNPPP